MIWKKQPVGSKLADLQNNKASKDAATQSAAGLMSASDKTKLDGVATGATAVSVVNSLDLDSTTSALSAAQGKVLNSKFRQITSGSFHDIKEPGVYWLYSAVTDKPTSGAGTYILNRLSNDYLSGIYVSADDSKLYSVKYSGGVWKYTPISDIINSKYEYTTAFDVPVVSSGCHFYFDRIGRTIYADVVVQFTSAVAANTQIAHVNNIANVIEIHPMAIGSNGTGARFHFNGSGRLKAERALPANEWFSFSFVGEYNVTL